MPDLVQCEDHLRELSPIPLAPAWTVHLWRPARGATPAGFDPTSQSIEPLTAYPCDTELYTVDIDADGKIDLVVPSLLRFGDGTTLTGASYDAIWVIDSDGEFARTLPYGTALPRPVVGDAGLVALAWHAQFERFGAPQVSRRFAKAAKRPMTAHDWAAWMAGKALVAAATAAPKGPAGAWAKALANTPLDGSKGTPLSFRAWDGQLRQTLLLTDGQGVVAQAPIEGLLHPSNVLDTLGVDAPEQACKATR